MAIMSRLKGAVDALLGVSAYQNAPPSATVDPVNEREIRESVGGNIQSQLRTKLRWYLEDLERAQVSADTGDLRLAAQLHKAMRRDGTYKGLMRSRTKGLIRLPKRYYGDDAVTNELKARNGTRSVFDEMCPPSELQLMDQDGISLGISVGELVPVKGRDYPVLTRLEPEFLQYRWSENRWYFLSLAGALPITPGDGRWVLHVPGGRLTPWASGDWPALGRAFINKDHAMQYRANYVAKLANPARLAYAPAGATEGQRTGFFKKLLAWGVNSAFELPPGWDAKLLESNGRGWEVFQRQIDTSDKEFMITLAGQIVTTTGGSGFSNADVPAAIRQDLIQGDGEELAYTVNTQILPSFIVARWGIDALTRATIVEWDTGTPSDKEKETRVMGQASDAIERLTKSLRPYKLEVDIAEVTTRFGIPVKPSDGSKGLELAPADTASVMTVDEARESQGLDPIEGEEGQEMVGEASEEGASEDSDGEDPEADPIKPVGRPKE